jgi:hypothetical protein
MFNKNLGNASRKETNYAEEDGSTPSQGGQTEGSQGQP